MSKEREGFTPRPRLTPKVRVQKKYPDAFAFSWRSSWCIYRPYSGGNLDLGTGKTAALAWADAERNGHAK